MSRAKTTLKPPTIEHLLTSTAEQTFDLIEEYLEYHNIPYTYNQDYIVTNIKSDTPIPLVCVHVDTVATKQPNTLDLQIKNYTISLNPDSRCSCLGADDRAGVWIALQLIASIPTNKTQFNFAFFEKEETGAIGSSAYARKYPNAKHSCLIGLDRANRDGRNCALYGYDNDDLTKLFVDQGYKESFGTFSDCSNLADHYQIPCVNLSVGYSGEHTKHEVLDTLEMLNTLQVMQSIEIPQTDYPMNERPDYNWNGYKQPTKKSKKKDYQIFEPIIEPILCDYCSEHKPLFETEYGDRLCEDCQDYATNY